MTCSWAFKYMVFSSRNSSNANCTNATPTPFPRCCSGTAKRSNLTPFSVKRHRAVPRIFPSVTARICVAVSSCSSNSISRGTPCPSMNISSRISRAERYSSSVSMYFIFSIIFFDSVILPHAA